MKNNITTVLAALTLSMVVAGHSSAQTPSPTPNPRAGTFADSTLSLPQRIQLANTVLTSGTDEALVKYAASWMLSARPVIHLLNAFPTFADSVISDPTLGGKISEKNSGALTWAAVLFRIDSTRTLDAKLACMQSLLNGTLDGKAIHFDDGQVLALKAKFAPLAAAKATELYAKQDYAGAVSTASGALGWGGAGSPEVYQIFRAKIALRSPDVLSWAKLVYLQSPFNQTQTGIDAVSSAYRALDGNLVRANAFIQFQKDGKGADPLADVPLPTVNHLGATPATLAMNQALAGNKLAALNIAFKEYATAKAGNWLNASTAFVAQWLRNIDGNLVRANAFVSAQSKGEAFTIEELAK